MASVGLASRRRMVPRQIRPLGIQLEYGNALTAIANEGATAFLTGLRDLGPLLREARRRRLDSRRADAGHGIRARELVDGAADRMLAVASAGRIESAAATYGRRTTEHGRVQLVRQIKAGLGIEPHLDDRSTPVLFDHFVAQNVSRMRALFRKMHDVVDHIVTDLLTGGAIRLDKMPVPVEEAIEQAIENAQLIRGIATGTHEKIAAFVAAANATEDLDPDDLRELLVRSLRFGEARARFIARDQVDKLNAQVNAARAQAIGITHFRWDTMHDPRVRKTHRPRHGKIYAYDDLPGGELPGVPVGCRCGAIPEFGSIRSLIAAGMPLVPTALLRTAGSP